MTKGWIFFIALLLILQVIIPHTEGYGYYVFKEVSYKEGNGCRSKETGKWYRNGQKLYLDAQCQLLECQVSPEGTSEITISRCGAVNQRPGCKLIRIKGHYPDCCPQVKC